MLHNIKIHVFRSKDMKDKNPSLANQHTLPQVTHSSHFGVK